MLAKNSALLVVDVQNDFCPGGKLAVNDGDKIIPQINKLIPLFETVIATQDWHPLEHISFALNHPEAQEYSTINLDGVEQILWPTHCVQGTAGAEFHKDLDTSSFSLVLRKGMNPNIDSYSAFLENDKKSKTGLAGYLHEKKITTVFIAGLATDFCVNYSANDAKRLGFKTYVLLDCCKGIDSPKGSLEKSIAKMSETGIKLINFEEMLP